MSVSERRSATGDRRFRSDAQTALLGAHWRGVEFGETSRQAIVREVQEELSGEITDLRLLGVLENRFTFDGEDGHEIVFVYDGRFADEFMYAGESVTGREANNISFTAHWIHPVDPDHDRPLYPDGLQEPVRSDSA